MKKAEASTAIGHVRCSGRTYTSIYHDEKAATISKDSLRPSSSMTILPAEAAILDWFAGERGVWKSTVYIRPHELWSPPGYYDFIS